VLFGPHTANFRETASALTESGGGFVVRSAAELTSRLRRLLAQEADRERAGEAGYAAVASRQGAVRRTLDLLGPLIEPRLGPASPPGLRS
jgi:3-deoxy-D-manno-octulosonic-acid transferase